jgi:hypothetical protein
MTSLHPNPPWVDETLKAHWYQLERRVGKRMMPRPREEGGELGSGLYGTVFATRRRGVVMKVTSDPSEARFVVAALSLGKWPDGIVRYYDIVRLPKTYRRRPVYAIWREEALSTGILVPGAPHRRHPYSRLSDEEKYMRRAEREFRGHLSAWQEAAHIVRTKRTRTKDDQKFYSEVAEERDMDMRNISWPWVEAAAKKRAGSLLTQGQERDYRLLFDLRGRRRLVAALEACRAIAEIMANTFGSSGVGDALDFYLDSEILLADVHEGNIGQVSRNESVSTVITDPGHAVFLSSRYDSLLADIEDPDELRRKVGRMRKPKPNPRDRQATFRRLLRI